MFIVVYVLFSSRRRHTICALVTGVQTCALPICHDLCQGDRYWNLADPGWAYGLYYGIIGPLLLGQAATLSEAAFSVERSYEVIRRFGITNLAGAPTAYRQMAGAPLQPPSGARNISSAGE